MKPRFRRIAARSGFSLLELLLVLGVLAILSGIASYSFLRTQRNMQVTSAVQMVDSYLKGARQVAINTRSERRVVLEMYVDPQADDVPNPEVPRMRMWVERRKAEFLDWNRYTFRDQPERYELASEVRALPPFVVLADINGLSAGGAGVWPNLERWVGERRIHIFFQFSNTGSVKVYPNVVGAKDPGIFETILEAEGLSPDGPYLHFCRRNTRLDGTGSFERSDGEIEEVMLYYKGYVQGAPYLIEGSDPPALNPAILNPGGGKSSLSQLTGNYRPELDGNPDEDTILAVERQIRQSVATLHVIPLTGRTRAYDYGVGYPFAKDEIIEGIQ